jgi:outer membrane protein TolC
MHRSTVVLCLVSLFAPLCSCAQGAKTLTLDESIAVALENNHEVRIARDQAQMARGALSEAKAARVPTLSIEGQHLRYDKVDSIEVAPGQSVEIGVLEQTSANAALGFPIDISGIIKASTSAAYMSYLAAMFDLEAKIEEVRLSVARGYYGVLTAKNYTRTAEEAVGRAEEHYRIAEANLAAGVSPRYDVLRAEVEQADARSKAIEAKNGYELALAAFNTTLGLPVEEEVDVADVTAEVAQTIPDPARSRDLAAAQRAEVLAAEVRVEAARKGVHLSRAGTLPSLGVNWQGSWTDQTSLFSPRRFRWTAAVGLSIPIYDGGSARAKAEQARAGVSAAEEAYALAQQLVRLDVQNAISDLTSARDRYYVAVKALDQAREAYRLAELRYREGVSTSVEVTDASLARTVAETNLIAASYDYRIALAAYDRAVGKPIAAGGESD